MKVGVRWLQKVARLALREIGESWLVPGTPLAGLALVEITVIDDAAITEVHRQFFHDATPTDVITFDHGEILISADTALTNAARFRSHADEEMALYLIHGLLHLNGYGDKSPAAAKIMRRTQRKILATCLARLAG